ncbi:MAG TPA: hypothetical protein VHN14_10995 [Kofleriaceae bacterium]|jgi:hypothetical protein|nr:hypothetical protein [Kofleriaceae bacterium]
MRGALVLLLLVGPAFADTTPHKEGQYGGVTPGELPARDAATAPARPRRPPPRGTLTWIGFEAKEGGAEVFFQSVTPFELTQRIEGQTLIVHLSLPRLGHNTWRQIDTRFFDNPLSSIVARSVGGVRATKTHPARAAGIEVRIAFKNAKDVREGRTRTASEADGMFYAYLRFPEDTGAPATAPPTLQEPQTDGQPATTNPPTP